MKTASAKAGTWRLGTRTFFAILTLAGPLHWAAPAAPSREAGNAEASTSRLMQAGEVPGLSMAVIEHGRLARLIALGVANESTGRPVRRDTIFEAASLSKPVVAYAFLKLVDKGEFRLDEQVATHVDTGALANDPQSSLITFRMLLAHTSGLPNELRPGENLAIGFKPGSRFSYSGIGYSFLQQAIERKTGQSFEKAVEQLVFEPLGMRGSSFVWRSDYESRKAAGHTSSGKVDDIRRPEAAKAPSSLHTTAADYGKFLAAVLNRRGLARRTWAEMTMPQARVQNCIVCLGKANAPENSSIAWGLGWGIETVGKTPMLFHWGENNGDFHTFVMGDPQTRSGLVVLTNSGNGHSIMPDIAALILSRPHPAFAWMGYDRYDSPARVMERAIVRQGAGAVLAQLGPKRSAALTESQWNGIGYRLLGRGRLNDAIRVFELNTQLFPASGNTFDSLGEAYLAAGRPADALKSYERALALDPKNENARQVIARLTKEQPR